MGDIIILYTNDCPKCNILKKKLTDKGISFNESHDIEEMIELGITTTPRLLVDGNLLEYVEAVKWVNGKE